MDEADGKSVNSTGEPTLISCGSYSTFALPAVLVRGRWYSGYIPSCLLSLVSCLLCFFLFSWLFVVCCLDSIGCIWTVIS